MRQVTKIYLKKMKNPTLQPLLLITRGKTSWASQAVFLNLWLNFLLKISNVFMSVMNLALTSSISPLFFTFVSTLTLHSQLLLIHPLEVIMFLLCICTNLCTAKIVLGQVANLTSPGEVHHDQPVRIYFLDNFLGLFVEARVSSVFFIISKSVWFDPRWETKWEATKYLARCWSAMESLVSFNKHRVTNLDRMGSVMSTFCERWLWHRPHSFRQSWQSYPEQIHHFKVLNKVKNNKPDMWLVMMTVAQIGKPFMVLKLKS